MRRNIYGEEEMTQPAKSSEYKLPRWWTRIDLDDIKDWIWVLLGIIIVLIGFGFVAIIWMVVVDLWRTL
jgi:hypothetical protein